MNNSYNRWDMTFLGAFDVSEYKLCDNADVRVRRRMYKATKTRDSSHQKYDDYNVTVWISKTGWHPILQYEVECR